MNNRIAELQQEIQREERNMATCHHTFTEAKYDPTTKSVGYGYRSVKQGSDIWGEYEGYRDETVPRWSRTCTKCGKIEYTEKQEPIVIGMKPKF